MPTKIRTAALLLAGLALTAAPSFAQHGGRRDGGGNGGDRRGGSDRQSAERAQPRSDGGGRFQRDGDAQPRAQAQPRADQPRAEQPRAEQPRAEAQRRGDQRGDQQRPNVAPRAEVGVPRGDSRAYGNNRAYDNRSNGRTYDNRSGGRAYNNNRGVARSYAYGGRSYGGGYRSSGYRPVYRTPYGWRPYGYRPGWSLNFYFGRPFGVYGGYPAEYGYYAIAPGVLYGSLRIVDAPPDAQVFVDGYYAGVVDDYDGVFQHLNLEPGSHHIEIQVDEGYPPLAFDVRVEPGQTVTYRANIG